MMEMVCDRILKKIYQAVTEDAALQALDEFGQKWDEKYPLHRIIYTLVCLEF